MPATSLLAKDGTLEVRGEASPKIYFLFLIYSNSLHPFRSDQLLITFRSRAITFDADYAPDGNSYLSVYGWTTDPLHEFYITESYGSYNPGSGGTHMGTVDSDGST